MAHYSQLPTLANVDASDVVFEGGTRVAEIAGEMKEVFTYSLMRTEFSLNFL